MSDADTLAGAGLLGAASGARSFTGVGALAVVGEAAAPGRPAKVFAHRIGRPLIALVAVQELIMDKLPQTPSRLEWLGLGTRLVGAAGCGAALALRDPAPDPSPGEPSTAAPGDVEPGVDVPAVVTAAALAVAAAGLTAWGGARWRAWATERFGRDWPGAVLEDVATVGLACGALRVTRR